MVRGTLNLLSNASEDSTRKRKHNSVSYRFNEYPYLVRDGPRSISHIPISRRPFLHLPLTGCLAGRKPGSLALLVLVVGYVSLACQPLADRCGRCGEITQMDNLALAGPLTRCDRA